MFGSRAGSISICLSCRLRLITSASRSLPRELSFVLHTTAVIARRQYSQEAYFSSDLFQSTGPTISSSEKRVLEAKKKWGDYLPEDGLNDGDLQLYKTLYGAPLKYLTPDEATTYLTEQEVKEDDEGEAEEVELVTTTKDGRITVTVTAQSQAEAKQYKQLRLDMQKAIEDNTSTNLRYEEEGEEATAEEDELFEDEEGFEAEEEEDVRSFEGDSSSDNYHILTRLGQFSTKPSTARLPREIEGKIEERLSSNVKMEHLKAAIAQLKPPSTVQAKDQTKTTFPGNLHPGNPSMSQLEAHAFLATVFPEKHATMLSTLSECRRRLGGDWVRNVRRVLDFGGGGAGIQAWRDIVAAENMTGQYETMSELKVKKFESKYPTGTWWYERDDYKKQSKPEQGFFAHVVAGSYTLRTELKQLLEFTTFLPRLPESEFENRSKDTDEEDPNIVWAPEEKDASPPGQGRNNPKSLYDVIIASDSLFLAGLAHQKKDHVERLWSLLNPSGGVLILIEAGTDRGFENIAMAREHMLKHCIISPEGEGIAVSEESQAKRANSRAEGMIIAPCTNHRQCPMFTSNFALPNRKDWCHFFQRWHKPQRLIRLSATKKDFVDTPLSYIAVRKGVTENRPLPPAQEVTRMDPEAFNELKSIQRLEQKLAILESKLGDNPGKQEALQKKIDKILQELDTIQPSSDRDRAKSIAARVARENGVNIADGVAEAENVVDVQRFMLEQSRIINKPIKAHKHSVLDVCTHSGTLERWTVPKSYSKLAHHDARKAQWGDIWALGAKTKVRREAREGQLQSNKDRNHVVIDAEKETIGYKDGGKRKGKFADKDRQKYSKEMKKLQVARKAFKKEMAKQ